VELAGLWGVFRIRLGRLWEELVGRWGIRPRRWAGPMRLELLEADCWGRW